MRGLSDCREAIEKFDAMLELFLDLNDRKKILKLLSSQDCATLYEIYDQNKIGKIIQILDKPKKVVVITESKKA